MEIVIVRPPLIYGEGVKGYFRNILKLLKFKIPLPFGSFINNKRSFIYLENFLDLLNILINVLINTKIQNKDVSKKSNSDDANKSKLVKLFKIFGLISVFPETINDKKGIIVDIDKDSNIPLITRRKIKI